MASYDIQGTFLLFYNKFINYDIVILGAVGDVLGNPEETISLLKKTVKKGGYIIIDDAYGNDENNSQYPTRER